MSDTIVETAVITLRETVTEAELVAASDAFQRGFLNGRRGFLRRELLKRGERRYVDLVHWASHEAAEAVMQAAATSEACQSYFALMEMDAGDPAEGVIHYRSLAVYAA